MSPLLDQALQAESLSASARAKLYALGNQAESDSANLEPMLDQALADDAGSAGDGLRERILAETLPVDSPLSVLLDEALQPGLMSAVGKEKLLRAVGDAFDADELDEQPAVAGRIGRANSVWQSALAAMLLLGVMGWIASMILSSPDLTDNVADGGEAGQTMQVAQLEAGLDSIAQAADQPLQDASDRQIESLAADIEVTLIDYELEGLVHSEELEVDQELDGVDLVWLSDADLF